MPQPDIRINHGEQSPVPPGPTLVISLYALWKTESLGEGIVMGVGGSTPEYIAMADADAGTPLDWDTFSGFPWIAKGPGGWQYQILEGSATFPLPS